MTTRATNIISKLLANSTNLELVKELVAEDATHISLNYNDPELRGVSPSIAQCPFGLDDSSQTSYPNRALVRHPQRSRPSRNPPGFRRREPVLDHREVRHARLIRRIQHRRCLRQGQARRHFRPVCRSLQFHWQADRFALCRVGEGGCGDGEGDVYAVYGGYAKFGEWLPKSGRVVYQSHPESGTEFVVDV